MTRIDCIPSLSRYHDFIHDAKDCCAGCFVCYRRGRILRSNFQAVSLLVSGEERGRATHGSNVYGRMLRRAAVAHPPLLARNHANAAEWELLSSRESVASLFAQPGIGVDPVRFPGLAAVGGEGLFGVHLIG